MLDRIEYIILHNLRTNDEFTRKVLPFLQEEYFTDFSEKRLFRSIKGFVDTYTKLPSKEALLIDISEDSKLSEDQYKAVQTYLNQVEPAGQEIEWLLKSTEGWCKDQAIYNAILSSMKIIDDKKQKQPKEIIPELLQKALGVSFDTSVGNDYLEDYQKQYEFYHKVEKKIPFDITLLNKITSGGLAQKSLNLILGAPGSGKSILMCHAAANYLSQGKNVLFLTLEMSEEHIKERIDANLLNIPIQNLKHVTKHEYENKFQKLQENIKGKLIVKEYPNSTAHCGHFRHLLNELYLKRNFRPDIIVLDYLNICASSRVKMTPNVTSYTLVKCIAEEVRGLAQEFNVPILSASQLNRQSINSSEVGYDSVSESHGISMTADLILAIITNDTLAELNQVKIQQVKNRYNDVAKPRSFVVGLDKSKMRFYDVEQTQEADEGEDDEPAFDKGKFGEGMKAERGNKRKDYSGVKFS